MSNEELDIFIAIKVFGMNSEFDGMLRKMGARHCSYSSDISAAWYVVDKMIEDGWEMEGGYGRTLKKWDFTFNNGCSHPGPLCDAAPMAICLAALCALGVEIPK